MPRKSMFTRATRYVKKAVKSRYYNKNKGAVRFNRIARDVYNLKQAINSEKKHHLKIPETQHFAQYTNFASGSGHKLIEITPEIPQGTGANSRVGNQVKLTGACLEFLMSKDIALTGTIAYKIYIIRQINGNVPMEVEDFLSANHFISAMTVYDTASQRNQQQMSNFRVVKTLYGRFQQDQNGITTADQANMIRRNFTVPLKFTKDNMIRYNTNGSTTSINSRYYVLAVASNGDTGNNTGVYLSQYIKWYYVDN